MINGEWQGDKFPMEFGFSLDFTYTKLVMNVHLWIVSISIQLQQPGSGESGWK